MAVADLVAEYGPDVPLPPTELEMAEYEQAKERGEQVTAPAPMAFDRPTQERRAKKAEKELAELGRVNPLALEEFAALEERYNFLSTQLEDVKGARKDLMDVIADVDERILRVFTEAYADVEQEFTQVFATLFPGGEGRLLLTNPSDMLTTGIEVEARPPGKKVKRLSLLSGGEKSLTAVAMLVADLPGAPVTLLRHGRGRGRAGRREPAPSDQPVRATAGEVAADRHHAPEERRPWRVADALYGVTMQGDGITQVISQRMRGQELVSNPS
ncbi:chromosome segregation protein SMC [Mycolicibacterium aubagnense]